MMGFYNKHIKNKYFNKILFTYTLIIILVLSLLSYTISRSFQSEREKDAINQNSLMLQSIYTLFESKAQLAKTLLKQSCSKILNVHDAEALPDYEYVDYKNNINRFLTDFSLSDTDIVSIVIVAKKNAGSYDTFAYYNSYGSRNNFSYERISDQANAERLYNFIDENDYGIKVMPYGKDILQTIENGYYDDTYTIEANIRELYQNTNKTGVIYISFSKRNLNNICISYNKNVHGYILLISEDTGEVFFDSSKKYINKKYSYLDKLRKAKPLEQFDKNEIAVGVKESANLKVTAAGIIPRSQLSGGNMLQAGVVALIWLICVCISIFLTYISIKIFSKNIRKIVYAIEKVQTGDLSHKIKINNGNDEITQISIYFNKMCDKLNEYIEKSYFSGLKQKDAELKQKTAELYSLQSQIDPHFLYNTLETIRMRAVTAGVDDVGEMIYILANLFRNSIKKDMIVRVSEELDYCKSYLELYNIRYPNIFEVNFNVSAEIYEYGIISHVLQPLIENSIIHGIDLSKSDNLIAVKGEKTDDSICIIINDNGNGIDAETLEKIRYGLENPQIINKGSLGILNVNQRIKLFYGNDYGIRINSGKGLGTRVIVRIPAIKPEEMKGHV